MAGVHFRTNSEHIQGAFGLRSSIFAFGYHAAVWIFVKPDFCGCSVPYSLDDIEIEILVFLKHSAIMYDTLGNVSIFDRGGRS
ncbi:MAG: hypothetical protein DRI91_02860 [Aquificota bacterium]|nr:MAG: hypothetical protein DRI91_02860 [Aquificota bacterium]